MVVVPTGFDTLVELVTVDEEVFMAVEEGKERMERDLGREVGGVLGFRGDDFSRW